jgi:hypothetical protein
MYWSQRAKRYTCSVALAYWQLRRSAAVSRRPYAYRQPRAGTDKVVTSGVRGEDPGYREASCPQFTRRVGGGTRHNAVSAFDAYPAWGSSHVEARIGGGPVREVGTTELWLPAA